MITGSQKNADGNLENWWDSKTKQEFLKRAQCIIEQYGNYTDLKTNLTVNGINTQGMRSCSFIIALLHIY